MFHSVTSISKGCKSDMQYKIERLVTLSLSENELRLILNAMNAFYYDGDGEDSTRLTRQLRESYDEMTNKETK